MNDVDRPLVADLYCGNGGWAAGFLAEGFRVVGFDNERRCARFYPGEFTLADVRCLDGRRFRGKLRAVVASPPCGGFSVARIGRNWTRDNQPKTWAAVDAVDLVRAALDFIGDAQPDYWFMENPVGKLRSLGIVPGVRKTITACAYGAPWRKPTDLWGTFPFGFYPRPMCHNLDPCHERAPRGSKRGVQGTPDANVRALVPFELAREIAKLCLP